MSQIHIAKIQTENFLKLRLVELNPTAVTTVGGKNGQGKTSLMNAIAVALGGAKLAPEDPIRHGKDEATIVVDLNGTAGEIPVQYRLTRRFRKIGNEVKSDLTITSPGIIGDMRSPQTMLDQLLGQAGTALLDPSELLELKEKDLTAKLMALVGIDLDTPKLTRQNLVEQRKYVHRDIEALKAKFTGQVKHDVPEEPIDSENLRGQIEVAQAQNREYEIATGRVRECGVAVGAAQEAVRDLEARLATAKQSLADHQSRLDEAELAASKLSLVDVAPLLSQMAELSETNRKIVENRAIAAGRVQYDKLEAQRVELNQQIDKIGTDLNAELAAATFPVPGLGFALSEDGSPYITYNGQRWSQASDGEQLHVATAIALQMAGDIKIVLIRRAALWDEERRQTVIDQAAAAGVQIFIELVGTEGDLSVVLEDGQVAGSTLL